ncbi:hypothetical protein CKAN_01835000 [Cinnamomum micranthum f. kanehirae]|uniref:DUF7054 domain-containing protein n=1 Tax=Cinnamomum micranthum f. kanehirae TaxID=337451 RepID=A0A443PEV7_9MAGN|nr:hypothetical protein CKAN_01835000 [Cinnamomum micranthum f. kanehirae]
MTSKSISSPKSDTSGRSASFHGRLPTNSDFPTAQIKRPESHPELLRRLGVASGNPISIENGSPRLTKLLLNVTIQRSLGPVHVVMSPENTVADLTKAALEMYVKGGRRPLLAETDPESFELHYSPFSLESLNPKEKLNNLGSRNFFMCPTPASVKSCSDEAKNGSNASYPLSRFMEFLL